MHKYWREGRRVCQGVADLYEVQLECHRVAVERLIGGHHFAWVGFVKVLGSAGTVVVRYITWWNLATLNTTSKGLPACSSTHQSITSALSWNTVYIELKIFHPEQSGMLQVSGIVLYSSVREYDEQPFLIGLEGQGCPP
jgi:hypothetical protein